MGSLWPVTCWSEAHRSLPTFQARRGENWFRCVCAQSIEAPFAARATLLDGLTALL